MLRIGTTDTVVIYQRGKSKMMAKKAVLLCSILLVLGFGFIAPTHADGPRWHVNDSLRISDGIPFVWLRITPSSWGLPVFTALPGTHTLVVMDNTPGFDGVQYWWYVGVSDHLNIRGWVEQQSLQPVGQTSTVPDPRQFKSTRVRIGAGIPFVWLRNAPSSYAQPLYTTFPYQLADPSNCLVRQAPLSPQWDGHQWWRFVGTSTGSVAGWVEERSLVDCDTASAPGVGPGGVRLVSSTSSWAAYEPFERGFMIWRQDTQVVYVFTDNSGTTYQTVDVATYQNWPSPTTVSLPRDGLVVPVNAFGKVWQEMVGGTYFYSSIGWATAPERGYNATINRYSNDCYVKCIAYFHLTLPDGRTIAVSEGQLSWNWVN